MVRRQVLLHCHFVTLQWMTGTVNNDKVVAEQARLFQMVRRVPVESDRQVHTARFKLLGGVFAIQYFEGDLGLGRLSRYAFDQAGQKVMLHLVRGRYDKIALDVAWIEVDLAMQFFE